MDQSTWRETAAASRCLEHLAKRTKRQPVFSDWVRWLGSAGIFVARDRLENCVGHTFLAGETV